jgi:hypothetical protein
MPLPPQLSDALRHAKQARESFLAVWPDGSNCHHTHAAAGFRALSLAIDALTGCQSDAVATEALEADGEELAATMPEAFGYGPEPPRLVVEDLIVTGYNDGILRGVSARGASANEPPT